MQLSQSPRINVWITELDLYFDLLLCNPIWHRKGRDLFWKASSLLYYYHLAILSVLLIFMCFKIETQKFTNKIKYSIFTTDFINARRFLSTEHRREHFLILFQTFCIVFTQKLSCGAVAAKVLVISAFFHKGRLKLNLVRH